mgnify:CR=1 FL=1
MTVQELIERLEECDPEADVVMDAGFISLVFVDKVEENYEYNTVTIS